MKYFIVTLLLIATLSQRAAAQGIQELLQELDVAETDSLKIAAYQAIVSHYRYSDIDSALFFAKRGLAAAQENNYAMGEAIMMYTVGQVNERHGYLDLAKNEYQHALEIYTRLGSKQGIAMSANGLGVIAGRTSRYDEATRYFLKALRLFEEIHDTPGIVQTYIKLGVVSSHIGNQDKALEYYLRAEDMNTGLPSSNASLTLLNNIGIIYGKRNDLSTALKYFHRGLRESDPEKTTGIHIALLGSLGLAYEKSGIHDSAWYFQQQALSMARQNNLPEEEARSLVNLAELVKKEDPAQSLQLLKQALVITEYIRELKLQSEVYESMIQHYKEANNFEEALQLSDQMQLLKDSLYSVQRAKEIANLQATHELARQENEIKNLALQNEKSIFQRDLMIAVALAAVAMIIIVWFYNTKISKLNTQLIQKQDELRNSNTIKDKLFSILGHDLRAPLHRVIGLLNILALKHQSPDETKIIEKLRQQSLNTLETLDNLLLWGQNQLKGIHLNQQTIMVKEQARKSILFTADYAAQKDIKLNDEISPDLHVHADPAHFDFIIRNLLSNAIKFSHSGGTVTLSAFASEDQQVVFSISDYGIGIPRDLQTKIFTPGQGSLKGTWNEKGTGIGLMLCREYIAENDGKLWFHSEEGKGSTFYFSLKQKQVSLEVAELSA